MNTPKGWVEVKIGKSNNVDQRQKQAQTWRPYPFKPWRVYRYLSESEAYGMETMIHKRLARYATPLGGSEWFILPMVELAEIDSLLSGGNVFKPFLKWRLRLRAKFDSLYREFYFLRNLIKV